MRFFSLKNKYFTLILIAAFMTLFILIFGMLQMNKMANDTNDINSISYQTQDIIKLTNIIWLLVLGCIFLMFIFMIIFQRKSNNKLIQMLYVDPVTRGDNWYKFRIDANKLLNSRHSLKKKFALINFDINRFKIINDSFGYQKGDEVLREVYQILKYFVKENELFTRYAADQFYFLLSFQDENEVYERINELNNSLHKLKHTTAIKIYYGVFYITERKDSIDRMADFASNAKNKIKGSNEVIISYFDDMARRKLLEEDEIEKNMHQALENSEFDVYLQPMYSAKEEKVTGAEALVRWYQKDGQVMSPGSFVPVFEKNGFIIKLDLYMLRRVCALQKKWLEQGIESIPISVNISRVNFAYPNLAELIRDIVDEYNIPHKLIELELTESAFLQNKLTLINTVTRLRRYGFLVSMDDFGAGYSSLNSLKDLPLDILKLDGEMFRLTNEEKRGQTVIRNTISMAKDLQMKVVAECIETKEQVEFLCRVGCDIIQGYYYAKPMPVVEFESQYLALVE